jgi:CRP-like cAMP-binding protein
MVLLGAAAPAAVLVAAPSLARVDGRLRGRQAQLDVLQSVPILAALPVPSIEHLARAMRLRSLAPAELVIRAGTVGSGFYVVTSGAVEVRHGDRLIRTMGPGEGFGEIALLRSVRRTADVRAGPAGAEVYALTRSDFVLAVTGCSPSATEAAAAIEGWAKDD